MDFARPPILFLLLLIPPGLGLAWWSRSRREKAWEALGQPGRPPRGRVATSSFAAVLLIVALAGPRWGRLSGSERPPGHDVILLVDASRSMAAEDAIPDRMGAVKAAATGLVEALGREPGDRVGVVAFAGRAKVACPLTENLGAAIDAIAALAPGSVSPGGTNLAAGLAASLDAFDDREPRDGRQVVVFTDGEDHEGSWPALLDRLRALRVIVHGVSVGDADRGQAIPVGQGNEAKELTYRGEPVRSRRTDAALDALRNATGGALVPMGRSRVDLGGLYRDRIAPAARRTLATIRPPERADRYAPFLAAALGLLAVAFWPSFRRRAAPGLAISLGIGLGLAMGIGAAPAPRQAAGAIAEGNASYRRGDFAGALRAFEEAERLAPNAPVPVYNQASALYQLGRFDAALALYRRARGVADARLRARIDFAMGNAAVARGAARDALEHYDACLATRATGPDIPTLRRDAELNRRFAARLLPPPPSPDPEGERRARGPSPRSSSEGKDQDEKSPESRRPGGNQGQGGSEGGSPPGAAGASSASGASGNGPTRPGDPPDRRLDAMLSAVRKAQDGRPADLPPPADSSGDVKDW